MRAIIDTNVLVSGLLWHGTPHALLERVRDGTVTLVSSPVLLAELAEVLEQPKFDVVLARSDTSRERSLAEIQQLAEALTPSPYRNLSAAIPTVTTSSSWPSPLKSI